MKEADFKLSWKRSPSADVVKQNLTIAVDGVSRDLEFGADTQELLLVLRANSSIVVTATVTDSEGQTSDPISFSSTIGDLETPAPPSDFRLDMVGSPRDVVEEPVPEPPAPPAE